MDNLQGNVNAMGSLLETLLQENIAPLPLVGNGNIRGRGLFWAIEFIFNKEPRTPFPLDDDFSSKVKDTGLEEGINILGNMRMVEMHKIDTAAITPPFIVTEVEIRKIVEPLKVTIEGASEPYLVERNKELAAAVL